MLRDKPIRPANKPELKLSLCYIWTVIEREPKKLVHGSTTGPSCHTEYLKQIDKVSEAQTEVAIVMNNDQK